MKNDYTAHYVNPSLWIRGFIERTMANRSSKIEGFDRNEWIASNALYATEFEAEASEIGLAYASNVEW